MKPGRDLDALVAEKVMGWRKLKCGECKNRPWLPEENPCEYWHNQVGKETAPIHDIWSGGMANGLQARAWSPSTDIAAAWEVVEKLRSKGSVFSLGESYLLSPIVTEKWRATFSGGSIPLTEGHGETAPHAICIAALKAVGYEAD